MSPELRMVLIMKETGWTYKEYLAQPSWVVDSFILLGNAEIEANNRKKKFS